MNYTAVEQLLMDDGFLGWYYHINEEQVEWWNKWIAASPENKWLAEEAVRWLARMKDTKTQKESDRLHCYANEIWSKVQHDIDGNIT